MQHEQERRIEQLRDQAVWESRREINLRIVLQNVVLCLNTVIIMALLVVQIVTGADPWLIWLVGIMSSTLMGQIWLHSGIRHAQFRRYFEDVLDPRSDNEIESWESFLHRMHPTALLGSRWRVSTKCVFAFTQLGVGIVVIASSLLGGEPVGRGIALLLAGLVFGFLTMMALKHPALPGESADGAGEADH